MVAPWFPPDRRVGAQRPWRLATHLRDQGWAVTVVAMRPPHGAWTPSEERLGVHLDLRWIPGPAGYGRYGDARRLGPRSSRAQWLDDHVPVDTLWPWLLLHLPRIQLGLVGERFDAVWSTADPWSSHLLAYALRPKGVRWVADFRDPWSLCPCRPLPRPEAVRNLDRRVEAWMLQQADVVTWTAASTLERYQAAYPSHADKMHLVRNTFDSRAFTTEAGSAAFRSRFASPRETLDLCYFGGFRRLSPATPWIDVLACLRERHPEALSGVCIRHMGPLDSEDAAHLERLGLRSCLEALQPLPYEEARGLLSRQDLLLVSTHPDRDDTLPAQLWDSLAAGRPVLSVAPNPEIGDILRRTHAGLHLDIRTPDVLAQAADLLAGCVAAKRARARLPMPCPSTPDALAPWDAPAAARALSLLLLGDRG